MPQDPENSFKTHKNYLRSFAHMAGFSIKATSKKPPLARLASDFIALSGYKSIQGATSPNLDQVRASLVNAWGTELLMWLGSKVATESELAGLTNNWGVVQAYYAIYHATQALAVAGGAARPNTHPKTQNIFVSSWVESSMKMPPWSLAVGADGPSNVPGDKLLDKSIHSWSACTDETCWSLCCKALRTTRKEHLPDALHKARQKKRVENKKAWVKEEADRIAQGKAPRVQPKFPLPQLTVTEKVLAIKSVRPHTMMDYLYRLRVKANYEDAQMFIEGPASEQDSREVNGDLRRIVASTMLVHELRIKQLVGKGLVEKFAKDWSAANVPSGENIGLAMRLDFL